MTQSDKNVKFLKLDAGDNLNFWYERLLYLVDWRFDFYEVAWGMVGIEEANVHIFRVGRRLEKLTRVLSALLGALYWYVKGAINLRYQ